MKLCFSWDDGALEDQKLIRLHEKYQIPGMFFVPTQNREGRDVLTKQMIRSSESPVIAFGGHTEHHTYLTDIPIANVKGEVLTNKQYLEDVLGHEVEHFCLPGGRYNKDVLNVVYKDCGYKTVRTADTMNFRYIEGILKPTFHFYPRGFKSLLGNAVRNHGYALIPELIKHRTMDYFDLIRLLIESEREESEDVIVIWGHSWELEQFHLWDQLETLMQMECVQKMAVHYGDLFT